jgi:hypothetical protein
MKASFLGHIFSIILFAFACDDHAHDDGHDHGNELSIEEEVCEHIVETGLPISSSDQASNAPSANAEHKRVEITLNAGTGYVSYNASEESDYLFFFSQAVSIRLNSNDGNIINVTDLSDQDYPCDEIVSVFKAKLGIGQYQIEITQLQSSDQPLFLVSEESN